MTSVVIDASIDGTTDILPCELMRFLMMSMNSPMWLNLATFVKISLMDMRLLFDFDRIELTYVPNMLLF